MLLDTSKEEHVKKADAVFLEIPSVLAKLKQYFLIVAYVRLDRQTDSGIEW